MDNLEECEILFLNTPIYREKVYDCETYLPPLGQGYIITKLIQNGINASLIDCVNERLGIDEVVTLINTGTFPNVALNIFSVNYDIVKNIAEKINRKVNWFFGGKAMAFLWESMLCWKWNGNSVTYTIGECDLLYVDLILGKCREEPIFHNSNQRVYCVDKNSIYYPADLDKCILDRRIFKDRAIVNHYGRMEDCLIASRGCIYNCAFCGGAQYANKDSSVRIRTPDSIISEIKEIIDMDKQVSSIRILDDLFLKDRNSIIQAITIFREFPTIHWRCMGHVNSFLGAGDLFTEMKESGCDEVFIGIESGASEVRKKIHKLGTVEDVENVVYQLLRVGIDVKGYFICGFPNESTEEMLETVQLANKLRKIANMAIGNFRATAFQFRPYHGTEIYDWLKKRGELHMEYRIDESSSSKRQYSYISGNYSLAENCFLKKCINEIAGG